MLVERRIGFFALAFELALTAIVVVPYLTHHVKLAKSDQLKTLGAVHVFLLEGLVVGHLLAPRQFSSAAEPSSALPASPPGSGWWSCPRSASSALPTSSSACGCCSGASNPSRTRPGAPQHAREPTETSSRARGPPQTPSLARSAPKPSKRYTPPKPTRRPPPRSQLRLRGNLRSSDCDRAVFAAPGALPRPATPCR